MAAQQFGQMNLFEQLGLIAIGGGTASAIAMEPKAQLSAICIAVAIILGLITGAATFLKIRSTMLALNRPSERLLALLYAGMFAAVLASSYIAAFAVFVVRRWLTL